MRFDCERGKGLFMSQMDCLNRLPEQIREKFSFHSYGHALEILTEAFPAEWSELQEALARFTISADELRRPGGNESPIPLKFDHILYPRGWREIRISGDLTIFKYPRAANKKRGHFQDLPNDKMEIKGYIDGHNIDFLKNQVACDLEWNSKDQTFDRDLLAMRTYFDCGIIDVGVIITRSTELHDVFKKILDEKGKSILSKYGASTTHMQKLLYRLDSRRNGGCPILAIGMKKGCIQGVEE